MPPTNTARKDTENLEVMWRVYLKDIQTRNHFANWSTPPFDTYMNAKRDSFYQYVHHDLDGHDIRIIKDTTFNACVSECRSNSQCVAFSFDRWNRWCYIKNELGILKLDPRSVTGTRQNLEQPERSRSVVQMYRYRKKAFREGNTLQSVQNLSMVSCESACLNNDKCIAYTFFIKDRQCILLSDDGEYFPNEKADSGAKQQE